MYTRTYRCRYTLPRLVENPQETAKSLQDRYLSVRFMAAETMTERLYRKKTKKNPQNERGNVYILVQPARRQ